MSGSNDVDSTIIFDTTFDTPQTLKFELTLGTILVYDLENAYHFFRVFHSKITRIIFNFGDGTHVIFTHAAPMTEFVFNFPLKSKEINTFNISKTISSILITGDVHVNIFGTSDANTDPFDNIYGQIVLSEIAEVTLIGDGPRAPAQSYFFSETCISSESVKSRILNPPSSWLCKEIMKQR